MITSAIIGVLLTVFGFLVDLLPDAGTLDLSGFGGAVSAMLALDAALPMHETLAMAAMCLTIIGGIFAVRLILTVWHAIPGKFS